MRLLLNLLAAGLVMLVTARPAAAQSGWSFSGDAGLSLGNQTDPSFAWWGAVHRRVSPNVALGLEAGRLRWNPPPPPTLSADESSAPIFRGLAHGGQELQHLSASVRLLALGPDAGSSPVLSVSAGAYRQVFRNPGAFVTIGRLDGELHPGFSIAFGGIKTRGIGPGAEFRMDVAGTRPTPSAYFTTAVSLHLNR